MVRFSLPQLESFHWLVELGSFKAVSERLNVSQPTITTRIRELERELGVILIDRQIGRSVPTVSGRALLEDVRGILRHADRISDAVAAPSSGTAIRLGLPDTLACTYLSGIMSAIGDADASIRLAIQVDHSESLYRRMMEDELDFAFVASDRREPAVVSSPVCEITLAWAQQVAADMLPTADPKFLARRTIITTPPPSNLHSCAVDWLGGERPAAFATCNSLPCIVDLIAGGRGVGIVPTVLIEQLGLVEKIALLKSNRTLAPDRIDLVYRASSVDRGHAALLVDCCVATLMRAPRSGIRALH